MVYGVHYSQRLTNLTKKQRLPMTACVVCHLLPGPQMLKPFLIKVSNVLFMYLYFPALESLRNSERGEREYGRTFPSLRLDPHPTGSLQIVSPHTAVFLTSNFSDLYISFTSFSCFSACVCDALCY